ncbi:hypothetical protein D1825_12830 [Cellulomonas rhizosphaerae]|uniref:Sporulation stage II protein D amidase enhancer LytB N-terminal domain-containing protein n=1 Tax=Cellulomonas rhizosphaerae TaxID=2293719 RepID=A0A413RJS1_9CELL|nr:hypothetical protein D1825_12830 [Cellulomonas rhizosphaerae]
MHLGSSATFGARWTTKGKAVNGVASLQRRVGTAWKKVATVHVVKGRATVAIKPTATATYRLHATGRTSATSKVTVVRNWLALAPATTSIKAGSAVTLSLRVYKAAKPVTRTVALQRLSGSKWSTIKTLVVSSKGTKVAVHPTATTSYRLAYMSLRSPARTVSVTRDWSALSFSATTLADSTATTTASVTWYTAGKKATGSIALQQRTGTGPWVTTANVKVVGGAGKTTVKPLVTRTYRLLAGKVASPAVKVSVRRVIPASFTIHGSGYGHGLGMSQYGAYAMARAGWTDDEIVEHYYKGGSIGSAVLPKAPLAVQVLGPGNGPTTSTTATVKGGTWRLLNAAGTTAAGTPGTTVPITVAVSGSNVQASVGGKAVVTSRTVRLQWESTDAYLPASTRTAYASVVGAQGTYRHGVLAFSVSGGSVNVVNELRLDDEYLYGLAEMPSGWGETANRGIEALKAQAVAGRSFALLAMSRVPADRACRCNLVDGVADQNFTGWSKESGTSSARWRAAVDATSGQALVVGGDVVAAYYFSSSGGSTLNGVDVWGTATSYLTATDDHWSLVAGTGNALTSWTASFTQAEAEKYFGVQDVVSISVATYAGGGMKTLTATTASGATTAKSGLADAMRIGLNAAATGTVRSPWVRSFTPVLPG